MGSTLSCSDLQGVFHQLTNVTKTTFDNQFEFVNKTGEDSAGFDWNREARKGALIMDCSFLSTLSKEATAPIIGHEITHGLFHNINNPCFGKGIDDILSQLGLSSILKDLKNKPWDTIEESIADINGARIAQRAGYNPVKGMIEEFSFYKENIRDVCKSLEPGDAHPTCDFRLNTVKEALSDSETVKKLDAFIDTPDPPPEK